MAVTESPAHRNARARRSRARATDRRAKKGIEVDPDQLEAARLLLLGHHGTRGIAAAVLMAGDGFSLVGGKKHKIEQDAWRCDHCFDKGNAFWVWPKNDCCHGKRGKVPCSFVRRHMITEMIVEVPVCKQCLLAGRWAERNDHRDDC